MPTLNVNLTEHWAEFVQEHVQSGRYGSASELMRDALRSLEQEQRRSQMADELDRAIQLGIDDIEAGRFTTETARDIADEVLREAGAKAG